MVRLRQTPDFGIFLLLLAFLSLSACKSDLAASDSAASNVSQDQLKCGDASLSQADRDKCSTATAPKVTPPYLRRLGDTPIVLDETPYIDWSPGFDGFWTPTANLPAQIQILKSNERNPIYPWTTIPADTQSIKGLNLVEGQSYVLQLRSLHSSGRVSDVVTSLPWTARKGSGTWTQNSPVNAPVGRDFHVTLWTGSKMIVWGGQSGVGSLNSGALYDPVHDTWTTMSTVGAPARSNPTGVWTGTEMIVFGGEWSSTGARYNPATDTWSPISTVGAPLGNVGQSAVWTGSKMLVWGGQYSAGIGQRAWTNTGAAYDPTTNTWSALPTISAPAGRDQHLAVWTGTKMIVWGGMSGNVSSPIPTDTGGIYDPVSNTWTAMSTAGAPAARAFMHDQNYHWTGSNLLIHGMLFGKAGGTYDLATNTWKLISVASNVLVPMQTRNLIATGSAFAASVWTGSKMIYWGGQPAFYDPSVGATGGIYDPTSDVWTGTALDDAPVVSPNASRAVWTGSKMLIFSGIGSGLVNATYTP